MRVLVVVLLTILTLAFAPAPVPKAQRRQPISDLTRLQGTWYLHEYLLSQGKSDHSGWQIHVEGDILSFVFRNETRSRWRITLDPSERPKVIAMRDATGKTMNLDDSLYSIEGDAFRLCYLLSGKPGQRPTGLAAGDNQAYMILRRNPP